MPHSDNHQSSTSDFLAARTIDTHQQNPDGKQRWTTVGTMYFGYAMFMVLRMIPTVTGAAMRKDPALQIDLEVWGHILATGTCGAIVGKFVGGWAADTFGGQRTFAVGLFCASVFVGLFATSTEVRMFQVTFFVTLLAKSAGWPAMAKIIPNWFGPARYGQV
ncbi:MAG: MFS transporter [Planctomycetaceae bacterium]